MSRRLVRGAQGEGIEALLDRALLDPDLASQLLKESNPANRAARARATNAHLGDKTSTLTDMLTGQPAPDDINARSTGAKALHGPNNAVSQRGT
ncbi:hypothetical protein [Bradyrhizobium sp. USDA 4518]